LVARSKKVGREGWGFSVGQWAYCRVVKTIFQENFSIMNRLCIRSFLTFMWCAFVAMITIIPSPAFSSEKYSVSGAATIIDGDTIIVNDKSIRLHGIDAPEVGQKCRRKTGGNWQCGKAAMERLAELAENKNVDCKSSETDGFDRLIAICSMGKIIINETLVREGLAWAYVKYSEDYVAIEKDARLQRLGIWQGEAKPAWEYRAEKWKVSEQKAPDGCPIKGNISKNGKIYHPPWSPWYSRTKVSVEKGERWFCSEREAIDAGWRAPRWR
jgi:endonuclease YncB( thermonuclease family)